MNDIAGHIVDGSRVGVAGEVVEGAKHELSLINGAVPPPPPPLVAQLIEWQRLRVFAIAGQSTCDRRCDAYIARYLGYHSGLPPGQRKALFRQAADIRKAGGRRRDDPRKETAPSPDGESHPLREAQKAPALAACLPVIRASLASRLPHDDMRREAEAEMEAISETLPVWPLCSDIAGFGALGLAVIVAEAGNDLSAYPNHCHLWKRLGLAPYQGRAMSSWHGRELSKEEWIACGYNPRRRGTIAGDVGMPLFFAKARNVYGDVYASRRAHTALTHPEWSKAHSDNDARRVMLKALIRDLWKAWRRVGQHCIAAGDYHGISARPAAPAELEEA